MSDDKQSEWLFDSYFFGHVQRVADFGEIGLRRSTSPKSTGVVAAVGVMISRVSGCLIHYSFGHVKRMADFGEIGLRGSTSPKSTGVVVTEE